MYSIVMLTAMTTTGDAPSFGHRLGGGCSGATMSCCGTGGAAHARHGLFGRGHSCSGLSCHGAPVMSYPSCYSAPAPAPYYGVPMASPCAPSMIAPPVMTPGGVPLMMPGTGKKDAMMPPTTDKKDGTAPPITDKKE